MNTRTFFRLGLLVLLSMNNVGCTSKEQPTLSEIPAPTAQIIAAGAANPSPTTATAAVTQTTPSSTVTRGRTIYTTQCTACHHSDPHKSGTLGPDVFGSSLELLEARITHANYPKDYTPKRPTHTMAALPHLTKEDITALHAYLNSTDAK